MILGNLKSNLMLPDTQIMAGRAESLCLFLIYKVREVQTTDFLSAGREEFH